MVVDVGVAAPAVVRPVRAAARPAVPRTRSWPSPLSLTVLAVALAITTCFAITTRAVTNNSEDRLLRLQTRQAGAVLQAIVPSVETPIAAAAAIAETGGDTVANFRRYASNYVGTGRPFVSMSLWQLGTSGARSLSAVGGAPLLGAAKATAFLSRAARGHRLDVTGLLATARPRLGYAYASSSGRRIVYAESALPPNRHVDVAKGSPFEELDFALYLGTSTDGQDLLETNVDDLPLTGRTASVPVPFGSNTLTLVASPVGELGGRFVQWRWRFVTLIGILLALVAALMTDRLVKRRRSAEVLTAEVEVLLADQSGIAQTLQRALRPSRLPPIAGVEIAARYLPGVNGIEIGGDWYDVIPIDDGNVFFVVGDVSGRGLDAGSIMASLHFAIRGFVSEGHDPATVLTLLGRLLDLGRDKHFATVLCGHVDSLRRQVTLANAGHLPPLLVDGDGTRFVTTDVGPPVGVSTRSTYTPVTIRMTGRATLLAYTDGLVERRGETLDEGMARLRTAAPPGVDLDHMLSAIVAELTPDGSEDDTALLGLRWT